MTIPQRIKPIVCPDISDDLAKELSLSRCLLPITMSSEDQYLYSPDLKKLYCTLPVIQSFQDYYYTIDMRTYR